MQIDFSLTLESASLVVTDVNLVHLPLLVIDVLTILLTLPTVQEIAGIAKATV